MHSHAVSRVGALGGERDTSRPTTYRLGSRGRAQDEGASTSSTPHSLLALSAWVPTAIQTRDVGQETELSVVPNPESTLELVPGEDGAGDSRQCPEDSL